MNNWDKMKGMYLQITDFSAVNYLRAAHLVSYYNYYLDFDSVLSLED